MIGFPALLRFLQAERYSALEENQYGGVNAFQRPKRRIIGLTFQPTEED
jgi:hypothetical protein